METFLLRFEETNIIIILRKRKRSRKNILIIKKYLFRSFFLFFHLRIQFVGTKLFPTSSRIRNFDFYQIVITFIFNSGFRIDKRRSDGIMNDMKRVIDCISMKGKYNRLIPIINRMFIFIFIYTTTDISITIIIRSIRRRRPRRIRTIFRFGLFLFDDGSSCCC